MTALADAIQSGRLAGAKISIVISDQPTAAGLVHAEQRGLKTLTIERSGRKREEHDHEIVETLNQHQVDLVCLAGYMRLLSRHFLDAYAGRILNIHPSLLPAFPGLDAQKQALEHGVKWTGCSVHLVDETLDGGPIIAQRVVPVFDHDTVASLSARILEQEHRLYVEAVEIISGGRHEVVGRRVVRKS